MLKKTKIIFILIFCLVLVLVGCSSNSTLTKLDPEKEKGSLKVTCNIPDESTESGKVGSILEKINPDTLKITLKKDNQIRSKEINLNDDYESEIIFNKLNVGEWNVNITVTETVNNTTYRLFAGDAKATIMNNSIADVSVELNMVPGDLKIVFSGLEDILSKAVVTLEDNIDDNDLTEEITNFSSEEITQFEEIQANIYDLKLELNLVNGDNINPKNEMIEVLPGRDTVVTITEQYISGEADISITWNLPPERPEELTAEQFGSDVKLEWEDDSTQSISGYIVYRSESKTGQKSKLTETVIDEKSYKDTAVISEKTYWYWVRSYNEAGLASDLSSPASITVNDRVGVLKLINSWGENWGPNNNGSLYITYPAVIENNIDFFLFEPNEDYQPGAVAVFEINSSYRGDWEICVEIGDRKKYLYDGNIDKSPQYWQKGGNLPFPDNKIVMDITELLPINNETVNLQLINNSSSSGTLENFSIEIYDDYSASSVTTYSATDMPVGITANSRKTISIADVSAQKPVMKNLNQKSGLKDLTRELTDNEINNMVNRNMVEKNGRDVYDKISNGYGTGLKPLSESQYKEALNDGMIKVLNSNKVLSEFGPVKGADDYSQTDYFPPVRSQGYEGSCAAWSMAYYMQTFYEAREHNWNLNSFDGEKIMSPEFTYQLINGGVDEGAYYTDVLQIIENIGVSTWASMPYDDSDHSSWGDESAWREAPKYRSNLNNSLYYIPVSSIEDIEAIKSLLDQGYLLSISIDSGQYPSLSSNGVWTADNYTNPLPNHANTVVGYDDSFEIIP